MSDKRFAVVFTGKIVAGVDLALVKTNLAQLFKIQAEQVTRLFTGKPVTVKKGLDEETAKKYQAALKKAGALCAVVDLEAVAKSAPPAPAKSTDTPTTAAKSAPVARSADTVASPVAAPAPPPPTTDAVHETRALVKDAPAGLGELEGIALDHPGALLIALEAIPDLEIDLTAYSMAATGEVLATHQEESPIEVDTSQLSVSDPGALLVEAEAVAPLQVDTSHLALDLPDTQSDKG